MKHLLLGSALLLFLAASPACGGGDDSAPPPQPSVTAAEALTKAGAAIGRLKSFHFLITHENGGSNIALGLVMTQAEGDISAPDRMYAKVKATSAGLNINVQTINIGDQVWITNPFNGQWQELPTGIKGNDLFNPSTGVAAALGAATNPAIAAGEAIDGVATFLITATVDSGKVEAFAPVAEAGIPVAVKVWLRASDFVPVRMRLEGGLAPTEAANLVRQLDLSAFDEPVEINPPEGS